MIARKCTKKDTKEYRNQDYFDYRKHHCQERYFYPGSSQNVHEKWGHNRCCQGGNNGHSDRKRYIAAGNIGDYVAGGSARTASNKNHTQCQICGKFHDFTQYPGYDWHDRILSHSTDDHFLWSGKNCPEVFQTYGQSHTEHDHTEKDGGIIGHPCKAIPPEKSKAGESNNDDPDISGCKAADFSDFL